MSTCLLPAGQGPGGKLEYLFVACRAGVSGQATAPTPAAEPRVAPGLVPGTMYEPVDYSECIDVNTGLPATPEALEVPPGAISIELQVRGAPAAVGLP